MNEKEYMDSEFPDEEWNVGKKPSFMEKFKSWRAKAPERKEARRTRRLEDLAYESKKVGLQTQIQLQRQKLQESRLGLQHQKMALEERKTRAFRSSPLTTGFGGSMFGGMNKSQTNPQAMSFDPYTFNPFKQQPMATQPRRKYKRSHRRRKR